MLWTDKADKKMTTDEQKLEILRKVENGSLSVEEGAELIGQLEQGEDTQPQPEVLDSMPPIAPIQNPAASGCWKAAWSMILVGGAILTGFSAYWIYQGYQRSGFGWGFWLSWIPLVIGVGLMIFGWALMESPWMHVRVESKDEYKTGLYVFSMPVPFNIARWALNNFGQYIKPTGGMDTDSILILIDQAEESIRRGEPFRVQVDEEEDGTKVDVFIN